MIRNRGAVSLSEAIYLQRVIKSIELSINYLIGQRCAKT